MGIIDPPGVRLWFRQKTDDLTRESSWHKQASVLEPRGDRGRPALALHVLCRLRSEPGDQDFFSIYLSNQAAKL